MTAGNLSKRKLVSALLLCLVFGVVWMYYSQNAGQAQEEPQYVGPDTCSTCHADVAKEWALTVHRRTLFNEDPSKKGCEACHGPGGPHIAGGGDKTKIIRMSRLEPNEAAEICQKCHSQEAVTLWQTGLHARAKLRCTNCHDPHAPGEKTLLADMENAKLEIEGLSRSIKQAELAANDAAEGSKEKADANERTQQLKAEKAKLQKELEGVETVYQRTAEPYVCYNCHKTQQVQARMVSHHPIPEGKMVCSDCHNPHGGTRTEGLLRDESVTETCFRCHADKLGPFTFEHPPVAEDCTICHNPHGSVQDKLLVQSQPFLCLKCHAGPHSRSNTLGEAVPQSFANYYTECTDCHTAVHGSDEHNALHY